jgi:6-pyruvoyltetrahydropterin/6-carboxytetrahydropterin synthase
MHRLTREVRFGIDVSTDEIVDGRNGFAGRPALTGLGHYFEFRLSLVGPIDPLSNYLRNITEIDRAVRTTLIPHFRGVALHRRPLAQSSAMHCVQLLEHQNALPAATIDAAELRLSPFLTFAWRRQEPTMIRLSHRFEFSAAHRLHNPQLTGEQNVATFGKCNNPHGHGHNYELQVTVAGTPDATGQLVPVGRLEHIVEQHVIADLDHKHLNIEVPEFRELNPSVENIAMVIYRKLRPHLPGLSSVTVWETPKTWCEYSE